MSEMASGWYPDPDGGNQQRFWDGDAWTDYFQPLAPATEEVRGASTATEDYPYLANAGVPAAPASGPITDGWAAHTPTTAWGTPAAPESYVQTPGGAPAPAQDWTTTDPTQEFKSGQRTSRGGLIAVISISVLVLALLIVGGFLAFRNGGSGGGSNTADISVNEVARGDVPREGEWVGAFTIDEQGLYVLDARAPEEDLVMVLRSAGGGTVANNDDRRGTQVIGGRNYDPLIVRELVPGDYEVSLSEYQGGRTDFELSITSATETIEPGQSMSASAPADGHWFGVLEVPGTGRVSVDVRGVGSSDPMLAIIDPETSQAWENDDRPGSLDPLVEEELDEGLYLLVIRDYSNDAIDVEIEVS